jgi:hypothetical protein
MDRSESAYPIPAKYRSGKIVVLSVASYKSQDPIVLVGVPFEFLKKDTGPWLPTVSGERIKP